MNDDNNEIELSDEERTLIVEKKATCPFIGPAIAQNKLPVRNSARNPLASIDDVRMLGNTGGGNLGDLLVLFANGNHAFMRGESGELNKHVSNGLFSLEFPGSQGSHPGHSGILQGDPDVLDSGRFSAEDFKRLTDLANSNSLITRSAVGRFIAENQIRDPNSKVLDLETIELLTHDLFEAAKAAISALLEWVFGSDRDEALREVMEKFTRLAGENNLVGSAGEFGLLFAFFANKPDAGKDEDEPALHVNDLKAMFEEKRLPEKWEKWEKFWQNWVTNTKALIFSAAKEYRKLKKD